LVAQMMTNVFGWALFCLVSGFSDASASDPAQGNLTSYPTAGVSFREPKGWLEQVKDKGKTIAWWISPDSRPGKPAAMIMIECGQTKDSSLEEVARGLAQNFRGTVDDHPTSLGGTRALRIRARNESPSLRPVEGLAAIHDGRLYLVMGGVIAGHSVTDELESIRASWIWVPIEPPFKHLEFRRQPLSLAKGTVTINVPALMRIYPSQEPDRVLDLGLHNFVRNAPDFLVYAQVVPLAQRQTFEEYKSQLSGQLQSRGLIKKAIEWKSPKSDPTRVFSDTIEAEMAHEGKEAKQTVRIRWALVKIHDHQVVSVNFTLPVEAPGDRDTYVNLAEKIVDTILPGDAASRATPESKDGVGASR
jgi:hypothetical protein